MEVQYNVIKGSANGKLVEKHVIAQLEPHQVYIETTHSGLCFTDEHYLHADQALGHEGVGIVRQVGQGVKSIKVGDRVGFGYTHEVCANCDNCAQGMQCLLMDCLFHADWRKDGISSAETKNNTDFLTSTTARSALAPCGMQSVSTPFLKATTLRTQPHSCALEQQSGRS